MNWNVADRVSATPAKGSASVSILACRATARVRGGGEETAVFERFKPAELKTDQAEGSMTKWTTAVKLSNIFSKLSDVSGKLGHRCLRICW